MTSKNPLFDLIRPHLLKVLTVGFFFHFQAVHADVADVYQRMSDRLSQIEDNNFSSEQEIPQSTQQLLDEKKSIEDNIITLESQLLQLRQRLETINTQLQIKPELTRLSLTEQDRNDMMSSTMGRCRVVAHDNGVFEIQRSEDEIIQFVFDPANTAYATIESIADNYKIFEIVQPAFNSSFLENSTEMEAKIRLRVSNNGSIELQFLSFVGQRIKDKIWNRSTFSVFHTICAASINDGALTERR